MLNLGRAPRRESGFTVRRFKAMLSGARFGNESPVGRKKTKKSTQLIAVLFWSVIGLTAVVSAVSAFQYVALAGK
jgi:hypothetical protein